MTLRSAAGSTLALAGSAVAAQGGASLEAIKYTATVLGAVYTIGKIVLACLNWGEQRVKAAVAEEIQKHFTQLPCVSGRGCEPEDGG